jgi:hypothetical protein
MIEIFLFVRLKKHQEIQLASHIARHHLLASCAPDLVFGKHTHIPDLGMWIPSRFVQVGDLAHTRVDRCRCLSDVGSRIAERPYRAEPQGE